MFKSGKRTEPSVTDGKIDICNYLLRSNTGDQEEVIKRLEQFCKSLQPQNYSLNSVIDQCAEKEISILSQEYMPVLENLLSKIQSKLSAGILKTTTNLNYVLGKIIDILEDLKQRGVTRFTEARQAFISYLIASLLFLILLVAEFPINYFFFTQIIPPGQEYMIYGLTLFVSIFVPLIGWTIGGVINSYKHISQDERNESRRARIVEYILVSIVVLTFIVGISTAYLISKTRVIISRNNSAIITLPDQSQSPARQNTTPNEAEKYEAMLFFSITLGALFLEIILTTRLHSSDDLAKAMDYWYHDKFIRKLNHVIGELQEHLDEISETNLKLAGMGSEYNEKVKSIKNDFEALMAYCATIANLPRQHVKLPQISGSTGFNQKIEMINTLINSLLKKFDDLKNTINILSGPSTYLSSSSPIDRTEILKKIQDLNSIADNILYLSNQFSQNSNFPASGKQSINNGGKG